MQNLTYLFCIAAESNGYKPEGAGVDGTCPVSIERFGGMSAVYSEVQHKNFIGEEADARMKELAFVAPMAARHEDVIMSVMKCGSVMPVRFGTVFSSLGVMRETLASAGAAILEFLGFISDKDEWDVRGFIDKKSARKLIHEKLLSESSVDLEKLPTGRRYFMEQKLKAGVESKLQKDLEELAESALGNFNGIVLDHAPRRLIASDVAGGEMDVFFHHSFLVRKAESTAFSSTVDGMSVKLADSGVTFVISGPWPPYSFTPSLLKG